MRGRYRRRRVPHPVIPLLSLYPLFSTTLDLKGGRERTMDKWKGNIYRDSHPSTYWCLSLFLCISLSILLHALSICSSLNLCISLDFFHFLQRISACNLWLFYSILSKVNSSRVTESTCLILRAKGLPRVSLRWCKNTWTLTSLDWSVTPYIHLWVVMLRMHECFCSYRMCPLYSPRGHILGCWVSTGDQY